MNKIVAFTWYCIDMFHCMLKAEFVTLISLKVPSGISHISNSATTMLWSEASPTTCRQETSGWARRKDGEAKT